MNPEPNRHLFGNNNYSCPNVTPYTAPGRGSQQQGQEESTHGVSQTTDSPFALPAASSSSTPGMTTHSNHNNNIHPGMLSHDPSFMNASPAASSSTLASSNMSAASAVVSTPPPPAMTAAMIPMTPMTPMTPLGVGMGVPGLGFPGGGGGGVQGGTTTATTGLVQGGIGPMGLPGGVQNVGTSGGGSSSLGTSASPGMAAGGYPLSPFWPSVMFSPSTSVGGGGGGTGVAATTPAISTAGGVGQGQGDGPGLSSSQGTTGLPAGGGTQAGAGLQGTGSSSENLAAFLGGGGGGMSGTGGVSGAGVSGFMMTPQGIVASSMIPTSSSSRLPPAAVTSPSGAGTYPMTPSYVVPWPMHSGLGMGLNMNGLSTVNWSMGMPMSVPMGMPMMTMPMAMNMSAMNMGMGMPMQMGMGFPYGSSFGVMPSSYSPYGSGMMMNMNPYSAQLPPASADYSVTPSSPSSSPSPSSSTSTTSSSSSSSRSHSAEQNTAVRKRTNDTLFTAHPTQSFSAVAAEDGYEDPRKKKPRIMSTPRPNRHSKSKLGKGVLRCAGWSAKTHVRCRNAALMEYLGTQPRYCAQHIDLDPDGLYSKCKYSYSKKYKCKEVVLKEFGGLCYRHYSEALVHMVGRDGFLEARAKLKSLTAIIKELQLAANECKLEDPVVFQRKNKLIIKFQTMRDLLKNHILYLKRELSKELGTSPMLIFSSDGFSSGEPSPLTTALTPTATTTASALSPPPLLPPYSPSPAPASSSSCLMDHQASTASTSASTSSLVGAEEAETEEEDGTELQIEAEEEEEEEEETGVNTEADNG
ncbi:NSL complex protein NSL2 [Balamuthia mandrillaris]